MSHEPLLSPVSIQELIREMQNADLGDERRNARLLQLVAQMASKPDGSFAAMCTSEAELEALYRFLRNEHFSWNDLLEPHVEASCTRACEAGEVLAIHDTSTFRVTEDADLDSYIQTGKPGFFLHLSFLVHANDYRRPLGVVAAEILTRPEKQTRTRKNEKPMSGAQTARLENREFLRWTRSVEAAERRLPAVKVIHVMDREGDSFELLSKLDSLGSSFVIRECKNRLARQASAANDELWERLDELLPQARNTKLKRTVHVGKRKTKRAPDAERTRPGRAGRVAQLRVARFTLELKKPHYLAQREGFPKSLRVNVVRVYEPAAPEGEEGVEWVLLTNLPVETAEDAERIVDIYRQRWIIEEYFKALKTGCGYGTRQLTNSQSIFNSLALFMPIAWKALALRHLADGSGQPASMVLDEAELAVLRAKAKPARMPLSANPTAEEVLALVARLGGHRKSSGPPGILTLMRGSERVTTLAEGWRLARAEM